MRTVVCQAFAKINLTLDILGRRPDGYHDLEMVMQQISLCDTVTIAAETGTGETVVSTDRTDLPGGPGNLAWRAAAAFYEATGIPNGGTEIFLEKQVPMQAGMAGGSADAAAVLRGLRDLLVPGLPNRKLECIAERVGSDVPFCVRGGTALAESRGERLSNLPGLPMCWIVVCKPPFGLSTPALFGRVRVERISRRPSLSAMRHALERQDLVQTAALLCNVFEEFLVPEEAGEICALERCLLDCGALGAAMTGSGPTVFGLFAERTAAETAVSILRSKGRQVFLAQPAAANFAYKPDCC